MGYISKLLYPEVSIALRSGIIVALIALSIAIYYGGVLGINAYQLYSWILDRIFLGRVITPQLVDALIQLLLITLFGASVLRERLFTGVIKGSTIYVSGLLVLSIITPLILAITGSILGNLIPQVIVATVLLVLALILYGKYPPIALSVKMISEGRAITPNIEQDVLTFKYGEYLELVIHGSPTIISMDYDEEAINVEKAETLTGLNIRIYPASIIPSDFVLKHKGSTILAVKLKLAESSVRELKFYVYFNDDQILETNIAAEVTKTLLSVAVPVVESVLARMNLSRKDIGKIQFYNRNNLYIDGNTKIGDLESSEVILKIYSVEKHLELLKYYKIKDVYELWDKLMRRLEFLSKESENVVNKTRELLAAGKLLLSSWW